MKKTVSLFLIIFTLFMLLVGCGEVSEDKTMLTYHSDNGYSVCYPTKYPLSSLGNDIDFVIMDEETGTNVTIQRTDKQEGISGIRRYEFENLMEKDGYDDISISSFEKATINSLPCIVAEFTCKESTVTKVIYDASDNTYIATLTQLPGIRTSVLAELKNVVMGLMA